MSVLAEHTTRCFALLAVSGFLGCTAPPAVIDGPALDALEEVPLARRLRIRSEDPTWLRVAARAEDQSFTIEWPDASSFHEVPLLGLKPDRTWTIDVILDDGRREGIVASFDVVTPALPSDFADVEVLAWDPALVEPGYLLATVRRVTTAGRHFLVAWDVEDLEVAWYAVSPFNFGDVRRTPEGTLLGLRNHPTESNFLLQTLSRWTPEPTEPTDVQLPTSGAHHEVFPMPDDSLLTLARYAHQSDGYPTSLEAPDERDQSALLVASRVIRFDRDGTLQWDVPLGDLLDDGRISMSSLSQESFGFDWLHTNAVIPSADGGAVVSVRHQDAVIKVSAAGELSWILGDPAGWQPEFVEHLLTPMGATTWPYHPHAPAWMPDGSLVMFDNHNFGHTPYTEPPAEPWASRVVAYRIDEGAGTVEEQWSWAPTGGPLQSPRMGDADPLPVTGQVLANFGWIEEGEIDENGLPEEVSMRLVAFDPSSGDTSLDLWLRAPEDGGPPGVRSYRSEMIPSLYADDVAMVTQLQP